jgi:hypothetical protein
MILATDERSHLSGNRATLSELRNNMRDVRSADYCQVAPANQNLVEIKVISAKGSH